MSQTCVNLFPGAVGVNTLRNINVHEISHQYFSALVSVKSSEHLWLIEGLASYCEALFKEEREGVSQYHALIESWASQEAIDAHSKSPAMAEMQKIGPFLAGRPVMHRYEG